MPISLLIPWFKLDPWEIPFPFIHVIKLQPFGLLVAVGILFGSRIAEWRAEKTGVPRHVIADFLVYTIMIGLGSSMLLNMAMYEPEKFGQIAESIGSGFKKPFPYPGLSSFGGFFGGVMAALWFRQKKRVSLLVLGDLFCFAFPFAWLFGRMGCFVVHDHPGLPSNFFLAVENYRGEGIARHDLGLYEVIWSAVMIPIVLWLGKKPRPWGFFMALVPLAYAPLRFGLDFLRESADQGGDVRYLGLTPGHYSAVLMTLAGIGVAVRVARGPAVTLSLDEQPPGVPAPIDSQSPPSKAKTAGRRKSKAR